METGTASQQTFESGYTVVPDQTILSPPICSYKENQTNRYLLPQPRDWPTRGDEGTHAMINTTITRALMSKCRRISYLVLQAARRGGAVKRSRGEKHSALMAVKGREIPPPALIYIQRHHVNR
ncbi:unnamed protein product [Lota lota]